MSFACVLCRCRVAATSLIQAMYLHMIRTTLGLQQIVRDQVVLNGIELQQLPFRSGHGGTFQGSPHQPKGVYEVTETDLKSWAPTKPDKACMRFRSVCGFVGRARINVNMLGFWKADTETRRRIVREIMDHFNVPEQWRMHVEHAALKKARDA